MNDLSSSKIKHTAGRIWKLARVVLVAAKDLIIEAIPAVFLMPVAGVNFFLASGGIESVSARIFYFLFAIILWVYAVEAIKTRERKRERIRTLDDFKTFVETATVAQPRKEDPSAQD